MNFAFSIIGDAIGGDEHDVKKWLEDAIKEANKGLEVVSRFKITLQEMD